MSLTSALGGPGPVRDWFEQRLPQTRGIVAPANRELTVDNEVIAARARDRGAVGHAVDLLLRMSLRAYAPRPVMRTGIREVAFAAGEVASEAIATLRSLRLHERGPEVVDWDAAARASLVLAFMEQTERSGQAMESVSLRVFERPSTVEGWLSALAGHEDVEDLSRLAAAAVEDHLDLRSATDLHLNPTFALSAALSGADADVIADGTLLDFKSTSTPRVVTREVVWQIVGYALLDRHDAYGLRSVGVSALRWRRRWVRSLDEVVSDLGWREGFSQLHADFAEWLARDTPPQAGG